jgi:hypothetical protein
MPASSRFLFPIAFACLFVPSTSVASGHRVLIQGRGKLAIVDAQGQVEWEMPWGAIHDIHVLKDGHILVQQGAAKVAEIDRTTKAVVWSYDSATQNGNAGKRVEVHAFQPLDDGRLMIAESGVARIIEVDRQGTLLKEVELKVEHPNPHTDTRLARKLATGNYLVCHEGVGTVREYNGDSGEVVWEYEVPLFGQQPAAGHGPEAFGNKCFAAVRLANGNTLISTGNGHGVLEVTPDKKIVWQINQRDLPGITLAWALLSECSNHVTRPDRLGQAVGSLPDRVGLRARTLLCGNWHRCRFSSAWLSLTAFEPHHVLNAASQYITASCAALACVGRSRGPIMLRLTRPLLSRRLPSDAPPFSVQLEPTVWRYGAFRHSSRDAADDLPRWKWVRRNRISGRGWLGTWRAIWSDWPRCGCRMVLPAVVVAGPGVRLVFSRVALCPAVFSSA